MSRICGEEGFKMKETNKIKSANRQSNKNTDERYNNNNCTDCTDERNEKNQKNQSNQKNQKNQKSQTNERY